MPDAWRVACRLSRADGCFVERPMRDWWDRVDSNHHRPTCADRIIDPELCPVCLLSRELGPAIAAGPGLCCKNKMAKWLVVDAPGAGLYSAEQHGCFHGCFHGGPPGFWYRTSCPRCRAYSNPEVYQGSRRTWTLGVDPVRGLSGIAPQGSGIRTRYFIVMMITLPSVVWMPFRAGGASGIRTHARFSDRLLP